MITLLTFFKKNIKLAAKSVFFNYKQYLCFFAALFIIQMFYGLVTISYDNNDPIEYQHVVEEYDYHMVLKDLNGYQANMLINNEIAVFSSDHIYEIVRTNENLDYTTNEKTYDIYLYFTGDAKTSEARLRSRYFPELKSLGAEGTSIKISTTPLLNFENNVTVNRVAYIFFSLLLLALSVFLLTALYNIRVNHFKFLYGIYMTFGADFKKLFATAYWELFVISLLTFVPAYILSAIAIYFIYLPSGFSFTFSILSIFKVLFYNLVIVGIAVYFPMKVMALKAPMGLIVSEDNSNLVASPRRSHNIMGKKFPVQYEALSIWRFRKYNIQLLFTAVVFSALFICGLYLANIYQTALEYPSSQFDISLSATPFYYDDTAHDELMAIDGITEIIPTDTVTNADTIGSHILVHKSYVRAFSNMVIYPDEDTYRVNNEVVYMSGDKYRLENLEKYEYEGDLNSINTNENTIIVGDSISNVRKYKYEVGDTITIAKKTKQIRKVDDIETGNEMLKSQLKYYEFEYETYTIGAIIKNIPSGYTPIIMAEDDYTYLTGKTSQAKSLEIMIDQSLTKDEVTSIEEQLRDWGRTYGKVNIKNTHALSLTSIEKDKHTKTIYTSLSLLILAISPLIWFFSQTLYYMKRENEFNILQSIGAVVKEIRQIYVQGGLAMGVLSIIFCTGLSYLFSYLMYYFYNVMLPYFSGKYVRYEFYMPWYAILTSVIVSVACGFLSAYLPYRSYIKHRSTLETGGEYE